MTMASQFSDMTSSSNFLDLVLFHVNIITGSGVMKIYFYKGLTRNPEIGNTSVWVFPNIWRLERVRNTKFSSSVSSKMLLNAAKCQGYGFYRFWVIKGKPTGGVKLLSPTTQIRVNGSTVQNSDNKKHLGLMLDKN